nr:hypothetical protein [uncultured bacterium]
MLVQNGKSLTWRTLIANRPPRLRMQTAAGRFDLALANLCHQTFDDRNRAFCWSLHQACRQPQTKSHSQTSNASMTWSGVPLTQGKAQQYQTKEHQRDRNGVRIGHQGIKFDHRPLPNSYHAFCGARINLWKH